MNLIRHISFSVLAGAFGLAAAFLPVEASRLIWSNGSPASPARLVVETNASKATETTPLPSWPKVIDRGLVSGPVSLPVAGRLIEADLTAMKLSLYQDNVLQATYPIVSKGRPGSPWETPTGDYQVETKEKRHFSSIGQVWMPNSLQFFGNFFIHGWPYYQNGAPVPEGYSGGCIRLASADAEVVYRFAEPGTKVVVVARQVVAPTRPAGYFTRGPGEPAVSARAYLVADLESGDIILSQNSQEVLPIASLTKLMTALISLETINQFRQVTVSPQAVATFSEAGHLQVGEIYEVGDLIYPLLLESSNDASEVLAEASGRNYFVRLMNEKAAAIGLRQTHFADPSGISPQNVSTAADLFSFARHLYHSKHYIFELLTKRTQTVGEKSWNNVLTLATRDGYLGGKSGETLAAGQTLAVLFALPLAEFENRTVAIILLDSTDRLADADRILDHLRSNVYYSLRPSADV